LHIRHVVEEIPRQDVAKDVDDVGPLDPLIVTGGRPPALAVLTTAADARGKHQYDSQHRRRERRGRPTSWWSGAEHHIPLGTAVHRSAVRRSAAPGSAVRRPAVSRTKRAAIDTPRTPRSVR